jgi:integrase
VASIRRVIHKSGRTSWQARWRDPAGEQRSRNFDRRVDAERHLTTVEARKLAGTYVDPRAGKVKLADFTEQTIVGWLNRRDSTKARDDSYLNSLILPTFANMALGAVHPTDIRQWVAQLYTQGYAPATIREAFQLLSRIFSDAVQAGLIVRSPCRNVTLPRVESSEIRFLSPDEIGQLADTIDPRYRAMVLTAAYTGCRFGEIAALDIDHYDPDRRLIRIERSLSEVRGYLRISEPKTPAARRAITIPTWLPQLLDEHLTTYPASPDGLIFTAPEGGPIRRNTFRSRFWLPAVTDSVGPPMRFHDLRHSHVALLIKQGTHPAVIAARLGHVSVKTVLDVYGHLSEGLDREAADTLESPWADSDVHAMWTRHREQEPPWRLNGPSGAGRSVR